MQMVSGGWKHQERILAHRMMPCLRCRYLLVFRLPGISENPSLKPRQPPRLSPQIWVSRTRLLPLPLLTDEQRYCAGNLSTNYSKFCHIYQQISGLKQLKKSQLLCWQGLLYLAVRKACLQQIFRCF